jgi:sulfite reductase alpha subunit-like flavoprotein
MLSDLIMRQDAYIYVSGRAKLMPKSVEKAFTDIVGTAMEISNHEEDSRAA